MNEAPATIVQWVLAGTHACTLGAMWCVYRTMNRSVGTCFSVTVNPEFMESPMARDAIAGYRREIAIVSMLAILVALATPLLWPTWSGAPLRYTVPLLLQTVVQIHAYLVARRKVLPFAVQAPLIRRASLQPLRPAGGGVIGHLFPYLMLFAAAVVLGSCWDRLPERYPMHWGISGNVDGWAKRSVITVFLVPALGIGLCLFLNALQFVLTRWGRPANGSAEGVNVDRIVRVSLLTAQYMLAAIFGFIALLPVMPIKAFWPLIGVTLFSFVMVSGLLIWIARQQLDSQAIAPQTVGDGTSDVCWKWGMFYVNANDAALFVPRRFGIGYTINLGNPRSLIIVLLLAALMAGVFSVRLLIR